MSANAKISVRLSRELADLKIAHKEQGQELDKWKSDYRALVDERNALIATIQELETREEKLIRDGALFKSINEQGYITKAILIPPYMERSYIADIDFKVIETSAYQRYPYYKEDNTIDKDQYKKYVGGII